MIDYPESIETRVSAEIGQNHNGSLKTAKSMVVMAALAGCWAVKFQKRTVSAMDPGRLAMPYLNPHSYGKTYGEHREALELSPADHAELWNFCRLQGIAYATSVWDVGALDAVRTLLGPYLKIPSASNEDWKLLEAVRDVWPDEVHISNGMATPGVEEEWRKLFGDRLVVYVATSCYPCSFADVCLGDLLRLRRNGFRVGLSGHHPGIAIDIAAAAMGALVIERHVTLDRTAKGTDHAASLEPEGLRKLVRDLGALRLAWNPRQGILPCEADSVKKLKVRTAR